MSSEQLDNNTPTTAALWTSRILALALLTLLVASLLPILTLDPMVTNVSRYVFAVATAVVFIVRLTERNRSKNVRINRLHRMEKAAAIFFCAAAFLLFYNANGAMGGRDWLSFLLAGAIMQLYASLMIDYEQRKEAKTGK